MPANRFYDPFPQKFNTTTGAVGAGWKLYFYVGGSSTTLQDTYSDTGLSVPNTNPVVADSAGLFGDIFLDSGLSYAVKLTDENDVQIDYASYIQQATSTQISQMQREVQAGSDAVGQVFTLTSFTYSVGDTQNLLVFQNGDLLEPGPTNDYEETSSSSITVNSAITINPGDKWTFLKNVASATVANAANITYTPAGSGAVATNVQAKLRETVSVTDFGADPTGVADSTAEIKAALSAAQALQRSFAITDNSLTIYNIPTLFFPAGVYKIDSAITADTNQALSWINIIGENSILSFASGITGFGGIGSNVTFEKLFFVSGDIQASIKTNNVDSSLITFRDCQFQAPRSRAIQIDSSSNSTYLSIDRCKFVSEFTPDLSTRIIYADTGDFISMRDCWISWNNTTSHVYYLGTVGSFDQYNCKHIPTGGTVYSWFRNGAGTFTLDRCAFGAENSVTDSFIEHHTAPDVSSPVSPVSLVLRYNTINANAASVPLVKFYRIPNMVDIEHNQGMISTAPFYVDATVPAGDLDAIGDCGVMNFLSKNNISNYLNYIDYVQGDIKAILGIPLQDEKERNHTKPRFFSGDVLLQSGYTGSYTPSLTNTATFASFTDEFGVTSARFTAGADDQTPDIAYTTMLNGLSAGVMTAVLKLSITTNNLIKIRVQASRSTMDFNLSKGDHCIHVPFYYDGGASQTIGISGEMENGAVLEWKRTVILDGSRDSYDMNVVCLGTAAPVAGQWYVGDTVYDSTPSAGGTMGWVCTTSGSPGTWKTFGTIAA
jgi:hypothetical protein